MESVDDQVWLAHELNTEKYWRAVLEYFPVHEANEELRHTTELRNRQAKARLGEIYIAHGDSAKALPIYEELSRIPDSESTLFAAIGHAGLAIVYDLQQRPAEMIIEQLAEIQDKIQYLESNTFLMERLNKLQATYYKNFRGQTWSSVFDGGVRS
jgi:hypothetical protein